MEKRAKTNIGFFDEMQVSFAMQGSINDYLVDSVDYDKDVVIKYLSSYKLVASCPRAAIDCVTKERICDSFFIYEDDKYRWASFLIYHIQKYDIRLPDGFVRHVLDKADHEDR